MCYSKILNGPIIPAPSDLVNLAKENIFISDILPDINPNPMIATYIWRNISDPLTITWHNS